MRPLIERFVRGESGVAAYSLVAAVLMLIGDDCAGRFGRSGK